MHLPVVAEIELNDIATALRLEVAAGLFPVQPVVMHVVVSNPIARGKEPVHMVVPVLLAPWSSERNNC